MILVKTKRNNLQTKVFINVCTHELIDKPGVKKKLDDKGEEIEGINIPMSVGANRKGNLFQYITQHANIIMFVDKDKAGVECYVYDIIVNSAVLAECKEDKTGKHRDFICQLAIQSLEQKYNEDLDRRYTLPKLKYMGTITSQHVRDRKSEPKIEEVTSSAAQSKVAPKPKPIQIIEVDLPYVLKWLKEGGEGNIEEDIDDSIFGGHKGDYVEPTMKLDDSIISAIFCSKIPITPNYDKQIFNDANIQLSPYKLSVKIQGYKGVTLFLPFAINPAKVKCLLKEMVESIQDAKDSYKIVELRVVMDISRDEWDQECDPGSQPWLIAQALGSSEGSNPYDKNEDDNNSKTLTAKVAPNVNDFPEDKFHVKLPSNVDPYTGVKLGNANDDFLELPEDRFHKKDAGSQFLINQREEAVKNKAIKAEKEREERKNDPNVEYIDVDAFRPGGKYYDKNNDKAISNNDTDTTNNIINPDSDILKRAADIVSTTNKDGLSSTIWSELL